jgi:hypothetical protein
MLAKSQINVVIKCKTNNFAEYFFEKNNIFGNLSVKMVKMSFSSRLLYLRHLDFMTKLINSQFW